MTVRATSDEVGACLKSVEDMYAAGGLPEEAFYKCLVTLASEYIVNQGDIDNAMILLNRCPPSYIGKILPLQMKHDGMFAAVVLELTNKIVQYGIIDVELHPPTMPPATA